MSGQSAPLPWADTTAFLRAWLTVCPQGQWLEVRPLKKVDGPAKGQAWFTELGPALAYVQACVEHGDDVYIGANPRTKHGGGDEAVEVVPWLFVDVDYGTVGHVKASTHPTREAALAALDRAPAPPTIVVDTGGGLHAWWALERPAGKEPWRAALRRLIYAVGGDFAALDTARILRVPGTLNFKVKGEPRPVTLVRAPAERFALRSLDLFAALPDLPDAPPKPRRAKPRTGEPRPFDRANDLPVEDVLKWLGVPMHIEGKRTYCACPVHRGSNTGQMLVGGEKNVATCFGDCRGRAYTSVDLVSGARNVPPRVAVNLLAEAFAFEGFAAEVTPLPLRASEPDAPPPPESEAPRESGVAPKQSGEAPGLLFKNDKGKPLSSFANVCTVLRTDPTFVERLAYNDMTHGPELDGEPVDDTRICVMREHIERAYRLEPAVESLRSAVLRVATERRFHPVQAYLRGLTWDGIERIDFVGEQILGVERNALNNAMLRCWFVAAVARALRPGCKMDNCLVLAGDMGFKKSTFFKVLAGAWFSDTEMNIGNKDAYQQLHAAWIYEWPEIDHMLGRKETGLVKGFLSSASDTFRAPYAAVASKHPRSTVIVGTVNPAQFLPDDTGSRRYWILHVTRVADVAQLAAWRDQLWAEAVSLFSAGVEHWLTDAEDASREVEASAYQHVDPWEAAVETWLRSPQAEAIYLDAGVLQVGSILTHAIKLNATRQTKEGAERVERIMGQLGWRHGRPRREGVPRDDKRARGYYKPKGKVK